MYVCITTRTTWVTCAESCSFNSAICSLCRCRSIRAILSCDVSDLASWQHAQNIPLRRQIQYIKTFIYITYSVLSHRTSWSHCITDLTLTEPTLLTKSPSTCNRQREQLCSLRSASYTYAKLPPSAWQVKIDLSKGHQMWQTRLTLNRHSDIGSKRSKVKVTGLEMTGLGLCCLNICLIRMVLNKTCEHNIMYLTNDAAVTSLTPQI